MPQVFPGASLMNPFSPHEAPQEFLMVQQELVQPTKRMSWLRFLPQLLKMPEAYLLQLVASAETPTGWVWMAVWTAAHPFTVVTELILKSPVLILQVPVLAVQGYWLSVERPWSLTYARPLQLNPPLHPSFPQDLEQSTICCSERLIFWFLKRAQDSRTPTAEKAQHDPQLPWFLTGETLPAATQSASPTMALTETSSLLSTLRALGLRYVASNSASWRAVNWFTPILQVFELSELCFSMVSRFLRKMSLRQAFSSLEQATLNCCFQSQKLSRFSSTEQRMADARSTAAMAKITFLSIFLIINLSTFSLFKNIKSLQSHHEQLTSQTRSLACKWRLQGQNHQA